MDCDAESKARPPPARGIAARHSAWFQQHEELRDDDLVRETTVMQVPGNAGRGRCVPICGGVAPRCVEHLWRILATPRRVARATPTARYASRPVEPSHVHDTDMSYT